MKRSIFCMTALLLLANVVLSACGEKKTSNDENNSADEKSVAKEEKSYPGYENKNGLCYRFFTQNEGETPQIGDVAEVVITCVVNDTMTIIPLMPNLLMMQQPMFSGDIYEGLAMMHKGDSASFIVDIDSTFKYFYGQPTLPAEYKSTDVMRFEIKLNSFLPEKEYIQNYANDIKKRNDGRAAEMKQKFPKETAKAAKELSNYMAKNKIKAKPTASGLYYVKTQEGTGEHPELGRPVSMHYTGKLLDGTVFDSSIERGMPFQFNLGVGQVIAGWDEGVQLMTKGEKGVLYIPYYLGYGDQGAGGAIPPFANLIFEVELVDFQVR